MCPGATLFGDGESWNWVSSNPSPLSGSLAHQSNIVAGLHQHYFLWASATLSVSAGDKLYAYVYLDPSNPPSQIMLQWADGNWEHRAYWGANNIPWGVDGTDSRRYMGPLPAAGSWVKLEVPASLVGLEGHTLNGMAFTLWGGRATWDRAGKATSGLVSSLQWLVTDHLGTPRIVIDQTGSLANIKRHDYLPFGEELFAPAGGRSTSLGYVSGDGVRQQFTQYERDNETGLDYAKARYYSNIAGRFTSVDPLDESAKTTNPQTWNRYSYVLNQPTIAIDPDGLSTIVVVVSPRSGGGTGSATTYVFDRFGYNRNISGRDTNTVTGSTVAGTSNRQQRASAGVRGGDTPFGVYTVFRDYRANDNGTQGGVAGQSARTGDTRFGTGIIYLAPVSGEVTQAGRDTIYLHGGDPLVNNQALTPTDGCVRYQNGDINALIQTVNDLATDRDPVTNVFIGDVATLNAMADERNSNGDYRYSELRNAGYGSADPQGRSPGNPPAVGNPEEHDLDLHRR